MTYKNWFYQIHKEAYLKIFFHQSPWRLQTRDHKRTTCTILLSEESG